MPICTTPDNSEQTPYLWRFLSVAVGLVFVVGSLFTTANHARAQADVASTTFPVEGMVCPFCEASVEKLLGKIDGVVAVEASAISGTVQVDYQPAVVSPEQLVEAVNTNTFYRAYMPGTEIQVPARTALPYRLFPLLLGAMVIFIGMALWWAIARRRTDPATGTAAQPKPQEVGENA